MNYKSTKRNRILCFLALIILPKKWFELFLSSQDRVYMFRNLQNSIPFETESLTRNRWEYIGSGMTRNSRSRFKKFQNMDSLPQLRAKQKRIFPLKKAAPRYTTPLTGVNPVPSNSSSVPGLIQVNSIKMESWRWRQLKTDLKCPLYRCS